MSKIVLGIESSCDDTSVSIIKETNSYPEILFYKTYGQEEILSSWGGVVPEIAARNHLSKMGPLIKESLTETDLRLTDISLVGVTTHPGLLGPLLTGLNAAKSISMLHKTSIIPVNHLYAHLEAIHVDQKVNYPYLGLLVSGGHTLFILVTDKGSFKILGSTIDDACGEAFDKGGKMLDLGYPSGKTIDELSKFGDKTKFEFPIGLKSSKDVRLSFSGIKTSLRVFLDKNPEVLESHPKQLKEKDNNSQLFYDVVASYQEWILNNLVFKLKYAIMATNELGYKNLPIVVGGGVASNSRLREKLHEKYKQVYFVTPKYCTDNAVMIANYALRNFDKKINYPDTLYLDARGRFIDKKAFIK